MPTNPHTQYSSGGDPYNFGEVEIPGSTTVIFDLINDGTADFNLTGSPRVSTSGLAAGTVSTPSFNPPAGYYQEALQVVPSTATEGAAIHYTTDGITEPTRVSPQYGGVPIPIPESPDETTLKARAYLDTYDPSAIKTAHYVIDLAEPVITIGVGIDGSTFNDSTPTITGTATDNKAIETVEVKIVNGLHSGHSTPYDAADLTFDVEFTSATWEFTFPDTYNDVYTVSVRVTDMSGRTAGTTISFTIATPAVWGSVAEPARYSRWGCQSLGGCAGHFSTDRY